MKLQNRLKSYTVVLLLSPLLFLGVAEWRDWQKECESTLHRAKNTRENGRVLCRDKRKQMRSFKSNDLEIIYVFFCITEHKFASEKRGMPKLR